MGGLKANEATQHNPTDERKRNGYVTNHFLRLHLGLKLVQWFGLDLRNEFL